MGSLAPCCPPSRAGSTHLPKTLPGCGSGPPSVERVPPNPVHAITWGPGWAVLSLTLARTGLKTMLKASLQVGDEHESLKGKPAVSDSVCTHTIHTPHHTRTRQDSWDLRHWV